MTREQRRYLRQTQESWQLIWKRESPWYFVPPDLYDGSNCGESHHSMYCWFLGISVNYVGLTSPPTTCEQLLVTSLMHGPSKCPWFKDTSVYRCFERFQASFHERREDEVPHQVNYQPGEEHMARHSSRPILGFRATRRVDWGYGTARADTKLFFPFFACLFPLFFFVL